VEAGGQPVVQHLSPGEQCGADDAVAGQAEVGPGVDLAYGDLFTETGM
jgi:hypothetical protein